MAINNIVHSIPAEATDLEYKDSNLTLMQHNLFEENNEWKFTSYAYHIGDYDDEMIAEIITKGGYNFTANRGLTRVFEILNHNGTQTESQKAPN